MLSNTCKTAIKAVIFLCSLQQARASVKDVAEGIHVNEHTVGKILQILVKQGLIQSTKGPSGGFSITDEQKGFPIIYIVEAIDGRQVFTACGLGLSSCSSSRPCPIHNEYKVARDHLEQLFREKKVEDLCESVNEGIAYLAN